MSILKEPIGNIESNPKNYTLKYLLYEDEQLQIIQEGVNMYYWIPLNLVQIVCNMPYTLILVLCFLGQLIGENELTFSIVELHFYLLLLFFGFFTTVLLELYVLFPFLKLYLFNSKEVRMSSLSILTSHPIDHILPSISIKLNSYDLNFPLRGERKKISETLYQYYGYPHTNLDRRFDLTIDKQTELIIDSKAISFSLSLTDPKKVKPNQYPCKIVLYVKDLSLFQQFDQTDLKE